MSLEARTYNMSEWNNKIMPLVENGKLKEVKAKHPEFLMVGQVFKGTLVDETGKKFRCTAWKIPGEEPHVEVNLLPNQAT
jgi:hypothetical protein